MYEFYRKEGVYCQNCFEGRWICQRTSLDESIYVDDYWVGFKWKDLFSKQPDLEFAIKSPEMVENVVPLTRQFVLLQWDTNQFPEFFQLAELNWSNGEATVGEVVSFEGLKNGFFNEISSGYEVLIDQNYLHENNGVKFILYNDKDGQLDCLHLEVDTERRRIQQLGNSFRLPCEKFRCLNLSSGIIRGFSSSTNEITYFDINKRQIFTSIQVHGLPLSEDILNISAWSSNRLYLRVVEGKHEQASSTIYFVCLKTGGVFNLSHKFGGEVEQLTVGPDNYLYVRTDKCIKYMDALPLHGDDVYYDAIMSGYLRRYQFFRLPVDQPESLLFLAATAVPRPLTQIANKIIGQRYHIPM